MDKNDQEYNGQIPVHDSTKFRSTMNEYVEKSIEFINYCTNDKRKKILIHSSTGI